MDLNIIQHCVVYIFIQSGSLSIDERVYICMYVYLYLFIYTYIYMYKYWDWRYD